MSPTPSPIDVFIHSAPAADWQVWAAFAPLIAAVVAGLIAAAALMQKRRADNRAEWWRRAQWALDASLSKESSKSELGQKAIEFLAKSRLAIKHRRSGQVDTDAIPPSRRPASVTPEERKVQIAAARARVSLDKLTGDVTEEWIIALSKEKPE